MAGRLGFALILLGVLFGPAEGVRAQEPREARGVVDEIRAHLQELEARRAVVVEEEGEDSEEARRLADRIHRLQGAVLSLSREGPEAHPEKRLDLDFQAAPLVEALEFLAIQGGLSFAYSPDVLLLEDKVTARMQKVFPLDAAQAILKAAGYAFDVGPGRTIVITRKDQIGRIRRQVDLLASQVEILELMLRQRHLQGLLDEGGTAGKDFERKKEFRGVLAKKGEEGMVFRLASGEEMTCRYPTVMTDSGRKIAPEIAARTKSLEVGDEVRVRCLLRDEGWVLQEVDKAE